MNPEYDDFFKNRFNTPLTSEEEKAFVAWAKENKKNPDNETIDYDLRGLWKSGGKFGDSGHATDRYKKPNHPTFSEESMYHDTPTPSGGRYIGGKWTHPADDARGTFTPSMEMLDTTHPSSMLKGYFNKYEPEYDLVLPESKKDGGRIQMPDSYSDGTWKLI